MPPTISVACFADSTIDFRTARSGSVAFFATLAIL